MAALLINQVVREVKSRSGEPTQVRVVMMKEPLHFHLIFRDKFVVHLGKQPPLEELPRKMEGPKLFHVRGFRDLPESVKAVQVPLGVSLFSPQVYNANFSLS